MPSKPDPELGVNSWFEDELYREYLHDHSAVDSSWKTVFDQGNGAAAASVRGEIATPELGVPVESGEQLQPLRGAAGRLAENMAASVAIPLATSQRTIAVKVMDENRRIINQHLTLLGRGKVSYTHIVGWAIVKALEEMPALNGAYAERSGQRFRVAPPRVNLGIAVDVAGRDGARNLMVPNIRNAG
ncbi:MAG: 2-oxo acid dehydrogenase subunit E2, partial [Bryobacteraceae bacterium]